MSLFFVLSSLFSAFGLKDWQLSELGITEHWPIPAPVHGLFPGSRFLMRCLGTNLGGRIIAC